MEILHLKLKKDLLKLALDYYDKSDEKWLTDKIDSYMNNKKILFSFNETSFNETRINPIKCSARIWDNGRGEKQCTHKIKEGNYCKKHHEMIKKEGILRFGDIRDKKPTHDLIKLKNGDIEKLHWIDPNPINQLQSVLNQQEKKVILSTPKLIID
jgi:hypothetical protein